MRVPHVIKKGSKIYCRKCRDLVCTFLRTKVWGDFLTSVDFDPNSGQGPWLNKQQTLCRKCSEPWFSGGVFLGEIEQPMEGDNGTNSIDTGGEDP